MNLLVKMEGPRGGTFMVNDIDTVYLTGSDHAGYFEQEGDRIVLHVFEHCVLTLDTENSDRELHISSATPYDLEDGIAVNIYDAREEELRP